MATTPPPENPQSPSSSSSSKPTQPLSSSRASHLFNTPPHRLHISSPSSSPSSRVIYSDRFIPSRLGSNFALFDIGGEGGKDFNPSPYAAVLRSVIFGSDHGVVPPETPDRCSSSPSSASSSSFSTPRRNIFRFKAEVPRYTAYSVGFNDDVLPEVVPNQPKASRKVSKSPYKVLDAPALQDDFYLNLVDWSSHNVLAVGLGNCVYLWNACSSKVTKLCDFGVDDSVCSVGWAQRGTYLAVGTSLGKLQLLKFSVVAVQTHEAAVGTVMGKKGACLEQLSENSRGANVCGKKNFLPLLGKTV